MNESLALRILHVGTVCNHVNSLCEHHTTIFMLYFKIIFRLTDVRDTFLYTFIQATQ